MVNYSDSHDESEVSIDESETQKSDVKDPPDFPEDLSKLTKRELMDLIPDDIKENTSQKDLKRLSKKELLALVDTILDQE